jgi:hypothetical protein
MFVAFSFRDVYLVAMLRMWICGLIFINPTFLRILFSITHFLQHIVPAGIITFKAVEIAMCYLMIIVF